MDCNNSQIGYELKNNFTSLAYLQSVAEIIVCDAIKCRVM
jgi:hypothetical protein